MVLEMVGHCTGQGFKFCRVQNKGDKYRLIFLHFAFAISLKCPTIAAIKTSPANDAISTNSKQQQHETELHHFTEHFCACAAKRNSTRRKNEGLY